MQVKCPLGLESSVVDFSISLLLNAAWKKNNTGECKHSAKTRYHNLAETHRHMHTHAGKGKGMQAKMIRYPLQKYAPTCMHTHTNTGMCEHTHTHTTIRVIHLPSKTGMQNLPNGVDGLIKSWRGLIFLDV